MELSNVDSCEENFYSLVCGNTVVFKPSSEAPGCACKLVEILEKAGIPKGVINLVTGPGGVVGNILASDKRVRMVSFVVIKIRVPKLWVMLDPNG
jgi:acyl-CoA reductase-like NAD-dependent aldehyde dehydrogenase